MYLSPDDGRPPAGAEPRRLNFPIPAAKGELLFSMVARCARLESDPERRQLLIDLFGADVATPMNPLPAALGFFFERYGRRRWASVEHLMEDHSILPLCRALVRPPLMKGVLDHSLQNPQDGAFDKIGALGPAAVRVSGGTSTIRFCPACRIDEISNLGFAVWWRSHQVPWVSSCWRHLTQLISRCPICKKPAASYHAIRMPPEACRCGHVFGAISSTKAEQKISSFYHSMTEQADSHVSGSYISMACRSRAEEIGLQCASDFARAFDRWAEQGLEASFNKNIDNVCRSKLKIEGPYVAEVMKLRVVAMQKVASPREILALPFLFSSWTDFEVYAKQISLSNKIKAKENANRGLGIKDKSINGAIVSALKSGVTARDLAKIHNVRTLNIYYLANRFGIDIDFANWRLDKTLLDRVVEALSQGCSAARASKDSRVPYRECLAIAHAYTDVIEGRIAKFSESTAKEHLENMLRSGQARARSHLKGQRNFAEVNAKDPEWVSDIIEKYAAEVKGAAEPVDWKARDLEFCERLLTVTKGFTASSPRITPRSVCKAMGISRKFDRGHLPMFSNKLSKIVESVQEAGDRRIADVIKRFGFKPDLNDLCDLAHCSRKTLRDYLKRVHPERAEIGRKI